MSNKLKAGDRRNQKHSVDLAAHLQACEMNYHRLMAILPGLREGTDSWQFEAGEQAAIKIHIYLSDLAPYTSTVEVSQEREGLSLPGLVIRLCHDASVAEIIAFGGDQNWSSTYDYPNPSMYQPDEKESLNRFLSDWLVFCRNHGLVPPDNCASVLVFGKC